MKPKILINTPIQLVQNHFNFVTDFYNNNDISLAIENEFYFNDTIKDFIRANKITLIGGKRLDKINQSILLSKLGINHPKTYFNEVNYQPISSIDLLNAYVEIDEFIVKPIQGARGIGVKKITRDDYKKCLANPKKEIKNVFKNEIETLKNENYDVSPDYIEDEFSYRNSFLIQDYIDVLSEYRLILFQPNNYLIYERVKKPGQILGNLSSGSEPKKVSDEIIKNFIEPFLPKLFELINYLKYPYLSIDLYIDSKTREVGLFEFQMEFAYEGFDYKEVKNYMVKSITHFL
jgi:hypothetical protein